ncbi:MAG TPA: hypothetical protein ENN44_00705 [Methanoculleus sp.]|nr:hypothetical protein [Methanoculleus sp.]
MQSYQLVFTKDLNEGARDRAAPGVWRSASGIPCPRVFFCAALIERSSHPAGGLHLRIADPTGACTGQTPAHAQQLNDQIAALPVPSFVSCAATVQPVRGAGGDIPLLHIEWMQEVPRRSRDRWMLSAAMRTVAALEQGASSGPATGPARGTTAGLVAAIEQALASVDPAETPSGPPPREHIDAVLDAISAASEGRQGADAEKVIAAAVERGIPAAAAKACISHLIEEGDCYCPQPGRLRIL